MKETLQKKTKAAPQRNAEVRGLHRTPSTDSPADRFSVLQRTIGNRAVERLFRPRVLQTKFKIGQPNDIYEQEADRVADQVMRMPDNAAISGQLSAISKGNSNIQMKPG